MSVGWSLAASASPTPAAATEWFAKRYAAALAAVPDAEFDTIIGTDCGETVTLEIVDVDGAASADPDDGYNGGAVSFSVGGETNGDPSRARLQLTGSTAHVGSLSGKSWYAASLVRMFRPGDADMGDTAMDAIGLWGSDDNRVGLGLFGNGSGGSTTNWVGYAVADASTSTQLGPALDGEESPVWHLFEMIFDVDAGTLSFKLDGVAFGDTIAAANVPASPGRLSLIGSRTVQPGAAVALVIDKECVIVASPRVGEIG